MGILSTWSTWSTWSTFSTLSTPSTFSNVNVNLLSLEAVPADCDAQIIDRNHSTEELRSFEPSSIENRARSSFFESPDILSFVFLLERPRLVRTRLYRNSRSIVPFFWSRDRFNNYLDRIFDLGDLEEIAAVKKKKNGFFYRLKCYAACMSPNSEVTNFKNSIERVVEIVTGQKNRYDRTGLSI